MRQRQAGQSFGQAAHIADGAHRQAHRDADRRQHQDRDERGWHRLGHARQQIDDGQPGGDHRVAVPGHAGQLRQLRHEDQDGERVDETGDDRSRDELHHEIEAQGPRADLDQPHQDRRGEKVIDAVIADQRGDDDRDGGGRGGNHRGPPAQEGNDDRDRDRGVEPDTRIDARDDRKADRLGDQGERDDEPGEHIAARSAQAGEPLGSIGFNGHENTRISRMANALTGGARDEEPCILLSGGSAAEIATRNFTGSLRMTRRLTEKERGGQVIHWFAQRRGERRGVQHPAPPSLPARGAGTGGASTGRLTSGYTPPSGLRPATFPYRGGMLIASLRCPRLCANPIIFATSRLRANKDRSREERQDVSLPKAPAIALRRARRAGGGPPAAGPRGRDGGVRGRR
ncbi:hypothetical protein QE379_003909 [Sphingomonas sp. SORGH_AS 879]|nr:hypothetical protein [Sphingomonas sp. SORGH_AS_0879]